MVTGTPDSIARPLCALCELEFAIKHSHIVTAHMARWAKRNSATGYFRQERAPSKPEPDLPKLPLLCQTCEGKFEKWERKFHRLWDAWCAALEQSDPDVLVADIRLPEVDWMHRLLVSLCWRALHLGKRGERLAKLGARTSAAHQEWQAALRSDHPPRDSCFMIMQARRMDELLQRLGHVGNRTYIFGTADISSTTSTIKGPVTVVTVHPNGEHRESSGELRVPFKVGVVKSYGFLFMGAHVTAKMPPVPAARFWGLVALEFLKGSVRRHRRLWANVSPHQRRKQADSERASLASATPALFMRLKLADERERAARSVGPKGKRRT